MIVGESAVMICDGTVAVAAVVLRVYPTAAAVVTLDPREMLHGTSTEGMFWDSVPVVNHRWVPPSPPPARVVMSLDDYRHWVS